MVGWNSKTSFLIKLPILTMMGPHNVWSHYGVFNSYNFILEGYKDHPTEDVSLTLKASNNPRTLYIVGMLKKPTIYSVGLSNKSIKDITSVRVKIHANNFIC